MQRQRYEYQSDFAKKYFQQGREEGQQQGREEGQRQAMQAMQVMLTRQLEQRFGALPAATLAALRQADADQLMRWGERVLIAASLDEVFAET